MTARYLSARSNWHVLLRGKPTPPDHRDCSQIPADVLTGARARLAASHDLYQQRKGPSNEIYYPPRKIDEEESIHDLVCGGPLDAIVTRNHYGSLVLNAHRALFIDVDMPGPSYSAMFESASGN